MGCGLAGAVHGGQAGPGSGAGNRGARREDVREIVVALAEGRDLVCCPRIRNGAAAIGEAAAAAVVDCPDGEGIRVGGRIGDALNGVHFVEAVAGGRDDDHVHRGQDRELVGDTVEPHRRAVVAAVAQRHVHAGDIVGLGVVDDPLQRLFDVAEESGAVVAEDFQRNDVGAGGHSGIGAVGGGGDAGDVGAMAVDIAGVGIVVGEVVVIDDPVGDTVVVGVGPKEGVVQIDAAVQHDNRIAAAVDAGETGVDTEVIDTDHRAGGVGERYRSAVHFDHLPEGPDRHVGVRGGVERDGVVGSA